MSRTLTEQKVLSKLGIENFRQITKDKVLAMATMLDKMDPEVAKKALEQFPDFSKTMKEILSDYKKTIDGMIEKNAESVNSFYTSCDELIISLQKELDKDELSFEERKYVIECMMKVVQLKDNKDSENKHFIVMMATITTIAVGVTATALLAALGGNTEFDTDSIKKIN